MPKLIIAEKPSVAKDIARVLGVRQRKQGFAEGNGWVITWCIGHLVELCEPHEYRPDWKRWQLQALPMLPESFQLRPIQRTKDQYAIVKRLLKRKDIKGVINACDAGREGELIFRYVYALSGSRKPIERLWISSMTDEAIQQGFANLQPGQAYDRLWDAARCRSEADWLVGLNATRAITLRTRQFSNGQQTPLFSVGRVQTPTLALLVRREHEIRNFVPEDYWQLVGHFKLESGEYKGKWFKKKQDRFKTEEEINALVARLQGQPAEVTQVEKRTAKEKHPYLFDLNRLQRTANKRFGMSAARTLEVAQKLYESHKLLTYPRTDSMFLSNDMKKEIRKVIRAVDNVDPYDVFAKQLLQKERLPMGKRVFNDAKVTDHHAIIPTPKTPHVSKLSREESQIYDLVVRRFLCVFFPDAVFEKTKIITEIQKETFITRGKVVVDPGWRVVAGFDDTSNNKKKKSKTSQSKGGNEKEKEEESWLPIISQGDRPHVDKLEIQKKKTKPPPRYTEATLLAAMEGAGKLLEEDQLKQAMKDRGLGTPATRANIIETLLHRNYVARTGKTLLPQEKGIQLVDAINEEALASPQLTGDWEAKLSCMARGDQNAGQFQQEVRDYVQQLITRIKQAQLQGLTVAAGDEPAPSHGKRKGRQGKGTRQGNAQSRESIGTCPSCEGQIIAFEKVFACRGTNGNEQGCGFRIFRNVASKTLSEAMGKRLLEKGKTNLLKGFTSRAGNKFNAVLVLAEGGNVNFEFPEDSNRPKSSQPNGKSTGKKTKNTTPKNTTPKQPSSQKSNKSPQTSKRKNTTPKQARRPKDQTNSQPHPTPPPSQQAVPFSARHPQNPPVIQASAPQQTLASQSVPAGFGSRRRSNPQPQQPTRSNPTEDVMESHQPYLNASHFRQQQPPPQEQTTQRSTPPKTETPHVSLGRCPKCQRGQIIRGRRAWGCNRWREGCRNVIPFLFEGRCFDEEEARELIAKGRVEVDGFAGSDGTPRRGIIFLDTSLDETRLFLKLLDPPNPS